MHLNIYNTAKTDGFFCIVTEEKDLVVIGGGVAGYVAAIKAGQEGMKVRMASGPRQILCHKALTRLPCRP